MKRTSPSLLYLDPIQPLGGNKKALIWGPMSIHRWKGLPQETVLQRCADFRSRMHLQAGNPLLYCL